MLLHVLYLLQMLQLWEHYVLFVFVGKYFPLPPVQREQ